MFLYLTADDIGTPTGGGAVTYHESEALKALGETRVVSRPSLLHGASYYSEPWGWDRAAYFQFGDDIDLAHLYAGTFGESVNKLKNSGAIVTYTIAAHDREVSWREHERLGLLFSYPHLTEPALWQRYIDGYRRADVIVCPSTVAARTVRHYGPDFENKRIEVIPHGCHLLNGPVAPLPARFTVGYLGAIGADKGLTYLLEAWGKLNYPDATLLLAGRDSQHPWVQAMVKHYVPRPETVELLGWQENVRDFYNRLSLYVQPSATEGFGIEVLEAMAHGRPVVCSKGAGAQDVLQDGGAGLIVLSCNADHLAGAIDNYKSLPDYVKFGGDSGAEQAKEYTWDKIQARYQALWKELLGGPNG